jgi:hypothetical protein
MRASPRIPPSLTKTLRIASFNTTTSRRLKCTRCSLWVRPSSGSRGRSRIGAPPLRDSPVGRARLRPVTKPSSTKATAITLMDYRDRSALGRSLVNRTPPGPAGDVALLLARLILGTIMFAHAY